MRTMGEHSSTTDGLPAWIPSVPSFTFCPLQLVVPHSIYRPIDFETWLKSTYQVVRGGTGTC